MDSLSAVIGRLFVVSAGRVPNEDEDAAIEAELASSLHDVPAVFVEALEALLARKEGTHPISADDATWSWTLQILVELLPGAAVAWEGHAMTVTLPKHALALFVETGDPASYRVGRPLPAKRLTIDGEGRYLLTMPPETEPLLVACEVHCVAGCCGTGAFDVTADLMQRWMGTRGTDPAKIAADHLDAILDELANAPERPVVSYRFNAVWPGREPCLTYLRQWRTCLAEALTRRNALGH